MDGEPVSTPTRLRKRSLDIAGHRTSVSLEDAFWDALRDIAAAEKVSLAGLIARIDAGRSGQNLSSAIRVYVLEQVRNANLPASAP
ncbi:MAG: ribbon-helix-helix domain-containing protein [Beijerinckiaceae bacterium]